MVTESGPPVEIRTTRSFKFLVHGKPVTPLLGLDLDVLSDEPSNARRDNPSCDAVASTCHALIELSALAPSVPNLAHDGALVFLVLFPIRNRSPQS